MKITDKMRLDWLNGETGFQWSCGPTSRSRDRYSFSRQEDVFGKNIREAIDAAIKASKRGGRK